MKNIISIDITLDQLTNAKVFHNGHLLSTVYKSGVHTFDIETNQINNIFLLEPTGPAVINWLTMFDMGQDKLVYYGICKTSSATYQSQEITDGSVWQVEYQIPVFTWLHHVLQYGWLVGK